MRRFALLFVLAFASLGAQAATYQYTGAVYSGMTDFTPPCDPSATCQNFQPAGRVTGQFTTAAPLGTLSDTSIVALVTSYSFSDGVHTFSSSDGRSRVLLFRVTTNLSGQITAAHISLQQWATASQPHVTNDWFGNLFINSTNGALLVRHNTRCDVVDAFDDTCGVTTSDTTSQSGASALAGTWTTVMTSDPTSVPTLSEWALLLLAALMAAGTAWRAHRLKRTAR